MPKQPSFQFYPGDWLRNDVSGCSLEAQGLWLRMMMIMHDSQIYGQLVLNNEPMSASFLAKKIGISPRKFEILLKELDSAGVINRKENGVIFSGRMERDELKRQQNRHRQENFRETHNAESNGDVTRPVTQNVTPVSHRSSSSVFPFPSSFSLIDFKRLIDWAVSENQSRDARLVEVAIIQTLINRNGTSNESDPINSQMYFEPEIKKMTGKSSGISKSMIDGILERRRRQIAEYIGNHSLEFP